MTLSDNIDKFNVKMAIFDTFDSCQHSGLQSVKKINSPTVKITELSAVKVTVEQIVRF